jgi:hypothetical protein
LILLEPTICMSNMLDAIWGFPVNIHFPNVIGRFCLFYPYNFLWIHKNGLYLLFWETLLMNSLNFGSTWGMVGLLWGSEVVGVGMVVLHSMSPSLLIIFWYLSGSWAGGRSPRRLASAINSPCPLRKVTEAYFPL